MSPLNVRLDEFPQRAARISRHERRQYRRIRFTVVLAHRPHRFGGRIHLAVLPLAQSFPPRLKAAIASSRVAA